MADCECILADLNEERRCHSETQSANEAAIEQIAQLKLEFADASARALAAELREGELRKHVDDLKSELATHGDLHKAAQEQSTQLRQEIARMQAKIDQTGIDAAALQIEIAAARAAAAAANERATADAAKAFAEIKALTIACEDAHRDAKEHSALAARLSGELGAVRRQADDYLALVKKRQAGSATLAARGSKSHAN
jgi:chromosome segregation ATPase